MSEADIKELKKKMIEKGIPKSEGAHFLEKSEDSYIGLTGKKVKADTVMKYFHDHYPGAHSYLGKSPKEFKEVLLHHIIKEPANIGQEPVRPQSPERTTSREMPLPPAKQVAASRKTLEPTQENYEKLAAENERLSAENRRIHEENMKQSRLETEEAFKRLEAKKAPAQPPVTEPRPVEPILGDIENTVSQGTVIGLPFNRAHKDSGGGGLERPKTLYNPEQSAFEPIPESMQEARDQENIAIKIKNQLSYSEKVREQTEAIKKGFIPDANDPLHTVAEQLVRETEEPLELALQPVKLTQLTQTLALEVDQEEPQGTGFNMTVADPPIASSSFLKRPTSPPHVGKQFGHEGEFIGPESYMKKTWEERENRRERGAESRKNNFFNDLSAENVANEPQAAQGQGPDELSGAIANDDTKKEGVPVRDITTGSGQRAEGTPAIYHKASVQLFFGSVTDPQWDLELSKALHGYDFSYEERKVIMDDIFETSSYKLFITIKTDYVFQEFFEVVQLYMCLKRSLKHNTVPSVGISLASIMSLTNRGSTGKRSVQVQPMGSKPQDVTNQTSQQQVQNPSEPVNEPFVKTFNQFKSAGMPVGQYVNKIPGQGRVGPGFHVYEDQRVTPVINMRKGPLNINVNRSAERIQKGYQIKMPH